MSTALMLAEMSPTQLNDWLDEHRPAIFAAVSAARNAAKPIRERKILDSTLDGYRDDFKRVEKAGGVLAASGSSKSFYKLRAAAERVLTDRIFEALASADRIRKKPRLKLANDIEWAGLMVDTVLPLKAEFDRLRAEKWVASKAVKREKSHRQRPKLGKMPKDWQARIWSRMEKSKYADAVAVAAVAGVRPKELEKGVTVALHKGLLVFRVDGAKVTEKNGHKMRAFSVSANSPMAQHLKQLVEKKPKKISVRSAVSLGDAFRKAAKNEFKKMTAPPSIYAFRHAFCAEAKATLDPVAVAQVMGHASTASQENYGLRRQGHGGLAVEPIGAPARQIRVAAKNNQPWNAPGPTAQREARAIASVMAPSVGARLRSPRPRI